MKEIMEAKDRILSDKQIAEICLKVWKQLYGLSGEELDIDQINPLPPEFELRKYNQAIAKAQDEITWKLAFEEGRKAGLKVYLQRP